MPRRRHKAGWRRSDRESTGQRLAVNRSLDQSVFCRYNFWLFGSLAQLVEQRTFNPLVTGSNPVRPTKEIKGLHVSVSPFPLGDESGIRQRLIPSGHVFIAACNEIDTLAPGLFNCHINAFWYTSTMTSSGVISAI